MKIEGTVGSEKKPVYTKPGLRELHTVGESRGSCSTGSVAIFDPKKK